MWRQYWFQKKTGYGGGSPCSLRGKNVSEKKKSGGYGGGPPRLLWGKMFLDRPKSSFVQESTTASTEAIELLILLLPPRPL